MADDAGESRPTGLVPSLLVVGAGRSAAAAGAPAVDTGGGPEGRARVGLGRIRDGASASVGRCAAAAPTVTARGGRGTRDRGGGLVAGVREIALERAGHRRRGRVAAASGRAPSRAGTIASSSGGTPGRSADGRGGVVVRRASAMAAAPSPENGRWPVERLEQDDPQRVDVRRGRRGLAAGLLGAEVVDRAHRRAGQRHLRLVMARAMPKSATLTRPSRPTRMFDGLTSRWTMPADVRGLEGLGGLGGDAGRLARRRAARCRGGSCARSCPRRAP